LQCSNFPIFSVLDHLLKAIAVRLAKKLVVIVPEVAALIGARVVRERNREGFYLIAGGFAREQVAAF
jgi:hypothetical protein